MSKILCTTAFLLGALAIVWMGSTFIGSDTLALAVIGVIGCVYSISFIELLHFRRATATLTRALGTLANTTSAQSIDLAAWLDALHPSLRNAVRLRIEGERVGLPAPVITPYLVGLLVMLGLLGTFAGMVDTLQGAVFALEGTTELQAIRAGLAAPIKGLSLAFGTSVAGIAASAILGLISTLSRRDRMLATRTLDSQIATSLRQFSLAYQRQETFKALQTQAQALPEVAAKLHTMSDRLADMGDALASRLLANQQLFHDATTTTYSDLAAAIERSLTANLADSARQTGEAIKPLISDTMAGITEATETTHQQLALTCQQQLATLSEHFGNTAQEVAQAWQAGVSTHHNANASLVAQLQSSLAAFNAHFEGTTTSLLESFDNLSSSRAQRQAQDDQQRLAQWTDTLGQVQQRGVAQLLDASREFTGELQQVASAQQGTLTGAAQQLESAASTLSDQWLAAGERMDDDEQRRLQQWTDTLGQVQQRGVTQLLDASQAFTGELQQVASVQQSTLTSTAQQLESVASTLTDKSLEAGAHIDELTTTLTAELSALRSEEDARGRAALDRLSALEATVATHISTLGKALEEPMARLIETASETPRAAAEVIGQLRREIANTVARDNELLAERQRIMGDLHTVSQTMQQACVAQREGVDQMLTSSSTVLKDVSAAFSARVDSELARVSDASDRFAGSAIELSSLGETFNLAVNLFNQSNSQLIEHLSVIEDSLRSSTERSDEQMHYYVSQAREIIDQTMLSQQQVVEQLHALGQRSDAFPAVAS